MEAMKKELFSAVGKGIKKHYGDSLPGGVEERIDTELDIIIGSNSEALFVMLKRLMDKVGLTSEDIVVVQSNGFARMIAYLIDLSNLNPFDCKKYYSEYHFAAKGEDIFLDIEIPYSKYDEAIKAMHKFRDLEVIGGENDTERKLCCYQLAAKDINAIKEDANQKTVFCIGIRGNKDLDILMDLRKLVEKNGVQHLLQGHEETLERVKMRASTLSTESVTLPLIKNAAIREALLSAAPSDCYEMAEVTRNALELNKDQYPMALGQTRKLLELSRYKLSFPDDYYDVYVKHKASDEVKRILDQGFETIIKRIDDFIEVGEGLENIPLNDDISALFLGIEQQNRDYKNFMQDKYGDISTPISDDLWEGVTEENDENETNAKSRYHELKREIQKTIIGNEELVDSLALALTSSEGISDMDSDDFDCYPRQNLFIIGGTGTGKTFTVKTAAKASDREFVDVNLAEVSAVGYVGKDLETVLATKASKSKPERWKRAVFFFDEVDKVVMTADEKNRERTFDLIPELLKLIEGETMSVKLDKEKRVEVSTRNMVFIFAGAFEDVNKTVLQRLGWNKRIGFNSSKDGDENEIHSENDDNILLHVDACDLEKYGISRQFLGRMNRIIVTSPMTEEGYRKILTQSKDSALLKQKRLLHDVYGIDLSISDEAIHTIASDCTKMKVGARGLNSIVNTAVAKGLAEAMKYNNISAMRIIPDEKEGVKCEIEQSTPKHEMA